MTTPIETAIDLDRVTELLEAGLNHKTKRELNAILQSYGEAWTDAQLKRASHDEIVGSVKEFLESRKKSLESAAQTLRDTPPTTKKSTADYPIKRIFSRNVAAISSFVSTELAKVGLDPSDWKFVQTNHDDGPRIGVRHSSGQAWELWANWKTYILRPIRKQS